MAEDRPATQRDAASKYDKIVLETKQPAVMFPEASHPEDDLWQPGKSCFLFVSDAQSVVNALNGHAPLQRPEHRPLFERVSRNVSNLLRDGWQPPRVWHDPFNWRPREYNVRADAVCNAVLDCGCDIRYVTEDLPAIQALRPNYLVYTDGGSRYRGTSAYAWIIYAAMFDGRSWVYLTVALCGRLLRSDEWSFTLESLAIEAASEMLVDLVIAGKAPAL